MTTRRGGSEPRQTSPWRAAFAAGLMLAVAVVAAPTPVSADGAELSGQPPRARRVTVGDGFGCAVLDTGRVVCWGANDVGQLGAGDTNARGRIGGTGANLVPVRLRGAAIAQIAAGRAHTCALTGTGRVLCWGANDFGQLGLGDVENRGDQPGEMGPALPFVDLGPTPARFIAAAENTTCAVIGVRSVTCWGVLPGSAAEGEPDLRGTSPGQMGERLTAVTLDRPITALALGDRHACALLDDGGVVCWGENARGELGRGDAITRGYRSGVGVVPVTSQRVDLGRPAVAVSAGGGFSCAVLDDGSARCWGGNWLGQLGVGDTRSYGNQPGELGAALPPVQLPRRAIGISSGIFHTCALLDNGTTTCWGDAFAGLLGGPPYDNRGDEPGEMGADAPIVRLGSQTFPIAVAAGVGQNCALMTDRTVKCWGQWWFDTRGDAPGEMGDNLAPIGLPSRVGPTGLVPVPSVR